MTSHYLNQCCPDSLTHICGTSGRWVKSNEMDSLYEQHKKIAFTVSDYFSCWCFAQLELSCLNPPATIFTLAKLCINTANCIWPMRSDQICSQNLITCHVFRPALMAIPRITQCTWYAWLYEPNKKWQIDCLFLSLNITIKLEYNVCLLSVCDPFCALCSIYSAGWILFIFGTNGI